MWLCAHTLEVHNCSRAILREQQLGRSASAHWLLLPCKHTTTWYWFILSNIHSTITTTHTWREGGGSQLSDLHKQLGKYRWKKRNKCISSKYDLWCWPQCTTPRAKAVAKEHFWPLSDFIGAPAFRSVSYIPQTSKTGWRGLHKVSGATSKCRLLFHWDGSSRGAWAVVRLCAGKFPKQARTQELTPLIRVILVCACLYTQKNASKPLMQIQVKAYF